MVHVYVFQHSQFSVQKEILNAGRNRLRILSVRPDLAAHTSVLAFKYICPDHSFRLGYIPDSRF